MGRRANVICSRGIRIGGRIYRRPTYDCDWADPDYTFELKGAL